MKEDTVNQFREISIHYSHGVYKGLQLAENLSTDREKCKELPTRMLEDAEDALSERVHTSM
jgi:hypothetical protein